MHGTGKLHHLYAWENRKARCASQVIPAGIRVLDNLLPDGGWPRAGVVEITQPRDRVDAMQLLMPALARITQQGRGLVLVAPPYPVRKRVFTDTAVNPVRVTQVNPHPGRSALWTVESLLESGDHGAVMAWPGCNTELMDKRLQKAATQGRVLCVLFRPPCQGRTVSTANIRLGVDVDDTGRVVCLVNGRGDRLAGAVWD